MQTDDNAFFFLLLTLFIPLAAAAEAYYRGDITYYNPGLGSCGMISSPSSPIVALSISMMANGPNPNTNPKCGSWITIESYYPQQGGKTHRAMVVDTCIGCAYEDLDLSPDLFRQVAGPSQEGNGRVAGIRWRW